MTGHHDDDDQWLKDQNDPDNWLQIPEFGVAPRDVAFKGFAFPIVGPFDAEESTASQLRGLVKEARNMIRKSFSSMDSFDQVRSEAFDILWPLDLPLPTPPLSLSDEQRAAVHYALVMMCFESAGAELSRSRSKGPLKQRHAAAESAAREIATGALMLLDWALEKPVHAEPALLQRMKIGASAGGRASGETRRAQSSVPHPAALRVQRDKLVAEGRTARSVASILATRYGCSADHIRKTLKRD